MKQIKNEVESQVAILEQELQVQLAEKQLELNTAVESGEIIHERASLELEKFQMDAQRQIEEQQASLQSKLIDAKGRIEQQVMEKAAFDILMEEPTFAGCLIKARPIGVLDMHDCGQYDGKLLCVPIANPRQENITSINQIAPNQLEDVAEFFRTSKGLDGRTVQIDGWRDFEVVEELLIKCTPKKKKSFKVLKKSSIVK